MRKWYGSLENRLEENKQYCDKIEVGTGVTEYLYSDRKAYEVVAVKDQKHITIREYDHKAVGEPMSNKWELISNENNPVLELTKRGDYWYRTITATLEQAENENPNVRLWVALNGFDIDKIREKGGQTKYSRMNISLGHADYYYDYSF